MWFYPHADAGQLRTTIQTKANNTSVFASTYTEEHHILQQMPTFMIFEDINKMVDKAVHYIGT